MPWVAMKEPRAKQKTPGPKRQKARARNFAAQALAKQQGYLTAAQIQRLPPERGKSMGL